MGFLEFGLRVTKGRGLLAVPFRLWKARNDGIENEWFGEHQQYLKQKALFCSSIQNKDEVGRYLREISSDIRDGRYSSCDCKIQHDCLPYLEYYKGSAEYKDLKFETIGANKIRISKK